MIRLHNRTQDLDRDLSRLVSKLSKGVSEKGVHRLRTTIRRLETLAHQAHKEPHKKEQKALEELRHLRKRAGKVRDLDIQIGLLASVGNGSASADRRALAEALKKKRAKPAGRLSAAARELEGSKLFGRVARVVEKSVATSVDDSGATLEQVRQAVSQLAAHYSSRQALKPERLHELRVRLKLLRYQAELAEETPAQKNLVEELKSVQDAIGEWHDWEMLAVNAEKYFAHRLNCALLVEIRSLLAARYSAACSAATNLMAAYTVSAKKQPSSLQPVLAFAQRA
jgi:CHAD domain-containing protein